MSELDKVLKPYTSHKQVSAAEITSVGNYLTNRSGELVRSITLAGTVTIELPDAMFVRYVPVPGDFLVVYEDGYQSFSPRNAFIDGYSRAPEAGENTLMDQLSDLSHAGPGVAPLWLQGGDWATQIARVAREAYVTINSLKFRLGQSGESFADIKQGIKDGKTNPDQA